jgi:UDP-N-acetylmuramate dehydrogenase
MHKPLGILLENEPLKEYSSWKVGGYAKHLYKPMNREDLSHFLKKLPADEPLLWIGLGSNTLIRDGGFPGTVIATQGALTSLDQTDSFIIKADVGVACSSLARFSARHDLSGIEFMAGIPGTVGGALRMNAGCFNGQTWDHIVEVECINRQGEVNTRKPSDFSITYRHVTPIDTSNEEWFLSGTFRLQAGNKSKSLEMIKELLERRSQTQPTNEANCGSVFRNPPQNFAARLIEQCGLKGHRIGGAVVSPKHANFIVNDGTAKASDIEQLIEFVHRKVNEETGISLIREVHIIGEQ